MDPDPDPGGQKTFGSYKSGSESATLISRVSTIVVSTVFAIVKKILSDKRMQERQQRAAD
jgi:hypothetical protein